MPIKPTDVAGVEIRRALLALRKSKDELVKVSPDDTTAGMLVGKLLAGAHITLTPSGPGDETLTVALDLTDVAGYDPDAMQVLTHISGTLTWVDVEECPE